MKIVYAAPAGHRLVAGTADGSAALLGDDLGPTWDAEVESVAKDGRAGRDADGDGIYNEKDKNESSGAGNAARAVGTAALGVAGAVGGAIAGKKLRAKHVVQGVKAVGTGLQYVANKLPVGLLGKITPRAAIGGAIGLAVAGKLADLLTKPKGPEVGVNMTNEEARAAAGEAHKAASSAGPIGSQAYNNRYAQEVAHHVAHDRAAKQAPFGSTGYQDAYHRELADLDPTHQGRAERVGRAITGSVGGAIGAALGAVSGTAAGAVGGAVAGTLASDLTGAPVSGVRTGAVAGFAAGGYKGAQAGYAASNSVGGSIGRGIDLLFKSEWDESKHPRDRGRFTHKPGADAVDRVASPEDERKGGKASPEEERKNHIARLVGTFTGTALSTVAGGVGVAGGVLATPVGSAALGFAASTAGDIIGRQIGERVTRAVLSGSLKDAYAELLRATPSDDDIGGYLGGVGGSLVASQALQHSGKLATGVINQEVASRFGQIVGSALGSRLRLAGTIAGTAAGEIAGHEIFSGVGKAAAEDDDDAWSIVAEISKVDDEKHCVYGWASVIEDNGQTVTDRQGDEIDVDELVKAAHEFMSNTRVAGEMHKKLGVGEVVESMVFTPELQKSMGINLGKVGWFVGMQINDQAVWDRVKKGELGYFSIGGRGVRKPVDTEAELKQAAGVTA